MRGSVVSESEEEQDRANSVKNKSKKGGKPVEEPEENGEEEEEEEEYEIEEILNAKKGYFAAGEMAYYVKWKGYDSPSDNSWVQESDAGNAVELIEQFWDKKRAKKSPRKSESAPAAKKGRKSSAANSPDPTSVSVASKKRDRKSKAAEESEDEAPKTASKRLKKGESTESEPDPEHNMVHVGESVMDHRYMKKYMSKASWEDMVLNIDTVERTSTELSVYFRLTKNFGSERVRMPSKTCNQKFPQKMLKFYESNLKWKENEIEVEEEDS